MLSNPNYRKLSRKKKKFGILSPIINGVIAPKPILLLKKRKKLLSPL
jgi:hypothetical protein